MAPMHTLSRPLFGAAALLALSTFTALACPARPQVSAAAQAGDIAAMRTLAPRLEDPACDDAIRAYVAETLAAASFREAMESSDIATRERLLKRSLAEYPHWRTYEALGRAARERGDRMAEAQYLQDAINRLRDGPERHSATEAEIAALYRDATVAVALADGVVATPRTRSAQPGGIFSESIRGFVVQEVPLPITFEFDSVTFTPAGRAYAQELLDYLLDTDLAHITLEGHTDPTGEEAYNDDLSRRRAEALRGFLAEGGYGGDITVVGRGEHEIPPPPEGIAPGSKEHYQIARRVVLRRS